MKKKTATKAIFAFLLFFSLATLFFPRSVNSQENACSLVEIKPLETISGEPVTITFFEELPSGEYKIELKRGGFFVENGTTSFSVNEETQFPLSIETPSLDRTVLIGNTINVHLKKDGAYYNLCGGESKGYLGSYKILNSKGLQKYECPTMNLTIEGSSHGNKNCIDGNSTVNINFQGLQEVYNDGTKTPYNGNIAIEIENQGTYNAKAKDGNFSIKIGPNLKPTENRSKISILKKLGTDVRTLDTDCSYYFPPVNIVCDADTDDISNIPDEDVAWYDVCQGNSDCRKCLNSKETGGEYTYESGGAWTALGCIPTDPLDLVKWIFPYLLGIGGTIAFFMLIIGGFQIMTSGGDPEKIKAGKEQITAAISGLLFIIFSLFILRFIGVDILGLPGLE